MNVETVADLTDPRLEPYRNVKDTRPLQERGMFLAEGRLVIGSLVSVPGFRVHSLLATDAALDHFAEAAHELEPGTPIYRVDRELMNRLSGLRFHQGCVAAAECREVPDMGLFRAARRLVILEQVSDPDNIGGIFRSAHAFGVDGILISPGCASPLYRKASRTSMGATFRVPFRTLSDWPGELEELRSGGFHLVGLTTATSATSIVDFNPARERLALVFGSEGFGLSSDVAARLDEALRIPMVEAADSLNVATSVGIALHRLGAAAAATV